MTGRTGSGRYEPIPVHAGEFQEMFAGVRVQQCDLCGQTESVPVLRSPNLDGPLLRCAGCGLHYVGLRSSDLTFGTGASGETAQRLETANANFQNLPRNEERRLNELNARWRLDLIRSYRSEGRLLEVGCGRGDFLRVAREHFDVCGVEPNPEIAADAAKEAEIYEGLVEDAPWSDFDLVVTFHVIEHVDSPTRFVDAMAQRLKMGGLLAIETPDIASWPFRLFRSRWRQFIPEHYYFFEKTTLARLLSERGFEIQRLERIGKYASLGLIANRLSRQVPALERLPTPWKSRAFRVNPRDILLALAVRK